MHRINRRNVLAALPALAVGATTSSVAAQPVVRGAPLMAFAYVGTVGKFGWNYAHERARRHIAAEFRRSIETTSFENVPEGLAAIPYFRRMIEGGAQSIVATTYGFRDAVLKLASEFPSVRFEHCTGLESRSNVHLYAAKTWESAFLAGALAAEATRSGVLGVLGSVPIPEVIRCINAFTLGAKRLAPDIEVRLRWVEAWWDPELESANTAALVRDGADCIFPTTNSDQPLLTASKLKARAFGVDSDMSEIGGRAHLASAVIDWTPYYRTVARDLTAASQESQPVYWGLETGTVDLAGIASDVRSASRAKIASLKERLITGQDSVWEGPIRSRDGRYVAEEGQRLSAHQVEQMNWLVAGVTGLLPIGR
jgi:simple sugar transport system substrate-binding protein